MAVKVQEMELKIETMVTFPNLTQRRVDDVKLVGASISVS
jgi:hypothetical protein